MAKIIVFTGAGFSYPLGLPLTTGFEKLINDSIPNDIRIILKGFLGGNYKDVEHVLSELEILTNKQTLLKYILNNTNENNIHFTTTKQTIANIINILKGSILSIKKGIFKLLKDIDDDKSIALYTSLLKEIKATFPNSSISFFTTNYDLSLEAAIDSDMDTFKKVGVSSIDFGFETNNGKTIFSSNKNYDWHVDILEYKKIHGSLDWIVDKKNRCIKTGDYAIPDNAAEMPLLYPGFKDTPTNEPFKSLHDQLLARLLEADIVISIGFAFRDPYINSLFNFAMKVNPKLTILCYNPCEISELPTESNIKSLTIAFPNRFFHILKGVDLSQTPLDLENIMSYTADSDNATRLSSQLNTIDINFGIRNLIKSSISKLNKNNKG